MEKIWIIIVAVAIFLLINVLYSKILKDYVQKAFGKKWLTAWGNKLYFWQSSLFVSITGTVLILYLLKWTSVLSF